MMNARRVGRLGMLAVGLGIGVAVASTPGIALADTPATDPVSWLAGLDLGEAAALPAASSLDLDISVDGFTLLDLGTGAAATSGLGDVAIAFGDGSVARAVGGFGDYALADSTGTGGATAVAGDDITTGATGNNFDFANAIGNGTGALSGNTCLTCPDTTGSSFDSASASGGDGSVFSSVAIAGDNGSGDSASAVGQEATAASGVSDTATPANFDSASVWGNLTTPTLDTAIAGSSTGLGGSCDTAFVVDPFDTVGSSAIAGEGFNSDLAGVFGDALNATATGANNLVDILPSLF